MTLIKGGLSTAQKNFINKWSVDDVSRVVTTEYTVRSGLNSFMLGDAHSDHSASQNKFTENKTSHINWFPAWQGIKPFVGLGQAMTVNPTARQYTKPFELTPNGSEITGDNVPYTSTVTLVSNESILRLEVVAGEAYSGDIIYTIKNNNANGIVMYTQRRQANVSAGDPVVFEFTYQGDDSPFAHGHPSENMAGSVIYVEMSKDDGSNFLVKSGATQSLPWLRLTLMNFTDQEISSGVLLITESQDLMYNSQYAADTADGPITLKVDTSTGLQSFSVFDANKNFSANPCNIDFGPPYGILSLNNKNDNYLFFRNGSQWRFLDMNTKDGGILG